MGRRARTRARADRPATAGQPPRRRALELLNPLKGTSRRRMGLAAVAFALLALALVAVGLVSGEPSWYRSATLLGLLAVLWGIRALVAPDRGR